MITDSTANISMPAPKGSSKKKRGNRTAKLKQCKLDARRDQWLSQVKKKGCKEEKPQVTHVDDEGKKREVKNLEIKPRDVQNEEPSDSDSFTNSPSSSILGSMLSGTNFTASRSGSSSGSCTGSVTDDDDCLDDWEALADALAASDENHKQEQDRPKVELPVKNQPVELASNVVELPYPKRAVVEKVPRRSQSGRAWKHDDAFRPQSLPNLAKQSSLPSGRNYGYGSSSVWIRKSVVSVPASCPICCEDLDCTDSSFHPCSCDFRLCLFCHKRILEEDGRCPGCRKPYEQEAKGEEAYSLVRSCGMITKF